jgi:acyl-CoA thioesterase YciA
MERPLLVHRNMIELSPDAAAPPGSEPAIRTIAMPADTNPDGDIFGGWLMAQMDLAAGNAAARLARGRCVTVAVDAMAFLSPVFVGDEVSLFAVILSTGRTSMRIAVEAWRRERDGDETVKVTQAIFTFVAIGADRKPRQLPPEAAIPAAGK